MKLHYDSDRNDITVDLNAGDKNPESFLIELGIGLAALAIRAIEDNIPDRAHHNLFEGLLLDEIRENLEDWHNDIFEL